MEEVEKPIKNCVVHLWKGAMEGAAPDDYVFGLKRAKTRERKFIICPTATPMTRDVFTRRWHKWVKSTQTGLGIPADAYSLKHSHTTELAAHNQQAAADFNGHKSTEMNLKHYDLMSEERKAEALKGAAIPFALPVAQGAGSVQPNA
jgi:hypothetical protein